MLSSGSAISISQKACHNYFVAVMVKVRSRLFLERVLKKSQLFFSKKKADEKKKKLILWYVEAFFTSGYEFDDSGAGYLVIDCHELQKPPNKQTYLSII